jgi:8-oxo-dGTP diphosphatase
MPMSEYVKTLRAAIGQKRLLLPSVSALIYDEVGRLLLVRQRDGDAWSTPGGAIEFDETPADAVVRETWEETGLLVSVSRIFGIYGGPNFVVHYDNGDEAQYVMVAFECVNRGGRPRSDGEETTDVRYWAADECPKLAPWLEKMFPIFLRREGNAFFEQATWSPWSR